MPDGNAIAVSSTGKKSAIHDPDAQLDYSFNWAEYVNALGVSIASHEIIVPAALTLVASAVEDGVTDAGDTVPDSKIVAWIAGVKLGKEYPVTCRITTTGSPARIDDRTVYLKGKSR